MHILYLYKKCAFKAFIENLKPLDKRYCQTKNIYSLYLSSELLIARLWKAFNKEYKTSVRILS